MRAKDGSTKAKCIMERRLEKVTSGAMDITPRYDLCLNLCSFEVMQTSRIVTALLHSLPITIADYGLGDLAWDHQSRSCIGKEQQRR